jgi:hypothetical protein
MRNRLFVAIFTLLLRAITHVRIFEAQPTKHIKNAKGGDERGYRGVSLNLTKPQGSTLDSSDDGDSATVPAATFVRFSRNQQERLPGRHIARDEQLCGSRVVPFVVQRLPGGITDPP